VSSRHELLFELTRRRVLDRFIGSSTVALWVVVAPLVPLATNLAVFYFVARIPAVQSMGVPAYAVYIFSGLLPFRLIQSAVIDATDLLVANMEMLKSVNFPLQILSMTSVVALALEFGLQLLVMLVLLLASGRGLGLAILLLPLALTLLVLLMLGASWAISVAGYLLRDVREILGVGFSVLLYLSPVLYPIEALPHFMATVARLNPVTHYIIVFRDALLPDAAGLHLQSWLLAGAFSLIAFAAGLFVIWRTKRFVGDMV
jgi:lipopolysaccharide transport system permease protein